MLRGSVFSEAPCTVSRARVERGTYCIAVLHAVTELPLTTEIRSKILNLGFDPKKNCTSSNFNELDTIMVTIIS